MIFPLLPSSYIALGYGDIWELWNKWNSLISCVDCILCASLLSSFLIVSVVWIEASGRASLTELASSAR